MALAATLGFLDGCTTLSFDDANAFNSVYHDQMLPALSGVIPLATRCTTNVYTWEPLSFSSS